MSNIDDGISITVTWISISDARRCKKCEALHNYQWMFKGSLPPVIEHPTFGVVWDIELNTSMAHEYTVPSINCRCQLEVNVEVNLAQIEEYRMLQDSLELL